MNQNATKIRTKCLPQSLAQNLVNDYGTTEVVNGLKEKVPPHSQLWCSHLMVYGALPC